MGRNRREFPWLDQRANDHWYVHWYDVSARQTRRKSLKTFRLEDAVRSYGEFLLDWSEDRTTPRRRGPSVAKVLDHYVRNRTDKVALDPRRIRNACEHLKAYFKDGLLKDVDVPACAAYADARRGALISNKWSRNVASRGAADGTIRRELLVLGAAARFSLLYRYITSADMPTILAPSPPPGRTAFLSRDELRRVFESASEELKDFVALAYYTGARRRAIETLTVGQVDLETLRIDLLPPDASAAQRASKKRRPIVPIVPELLVRLERLVADRAESDQLLPVRDYYSRFREHLTQCGLEKKGYPHILRHTRATHLLQDGVSVYDVAKLLGDTPATVEKTYGHHSSDYLANSLKGKGPKLD